VSGSPAADLRRAIVLEDTARFQAIPASGRRPRSASCSSSRRARRRARADLVGWRTQPHLVARDALVELGYSVGEAEQALGRVDRSLPPEERVRQALKAA
jgi:Holliday junction resolvasome RuvABC DNA-binding subunit